MTDIKIKTILTDGAQEYVGEKSEFKLFCNEIKCEPIESSAYCHWENGVAERVILKMMRHAFCILSHRDIPAQFWLMALKHVYMVLACCPHAHFGDKDTPYRRYYDKKPNGELTGRRDLGNSEG